MPLRTPDLGYIQLSHRRQHSRISRYAFAAISPVIRKAAQAGVKSLLEGAATFDMHREIERFRPAFIRRMTPEWQRSLQAGISFEADWLGESLEFEQAWTPRGIPKPSLAFLGNVRTWIAERASSVWRRLSAWLSKRLMRGWVRSRDLQAEQILDVMQQLADNTDFMARAYALMETTYGLNAGGHFVRLELSIGHKIWLSTLDSHTRRGRYDHWKPHSQVQPVSYPFVVSNERLQFPGDTSEGATAGNIFNCFLPGTVVSGEFEAVSRSFYDGQAVEIEVDSGPVLRVTKNHPILTEYGFIPACAIQDGQQLFHHMVDIDQSPRLASGIVPPSLPSNDQYAPSVVEEIFGAAMSLNGLCERRRCAAVDFHGDGEFLQGDVEVVPFDRPLLVGRKSSIGNRLAEFGLVGEDAYLATLPAGGMLHSLFDAMFASPDGIPSRSALPLNHPAAFLDVLPFQQLGGSSTSHRNASFPQHSSQSATGDAIPVGKGLEGLSALVSGNEIVRGVEFTNGDDFTALLDEHSPNDVFAESCHSYQLSNRLPGTVETCKVVGVRNFHYTGHVYDLQSVNGLVTADSIVCSNCRCLAVGFARR